MTGSFKTRENAENLVIYMKSKFFRFLVSQFMFSHHITRSAYRLVPVQDFSKPWTDNELYAKYNLTEDEITYIESMIRPMPANGSANEETILEEDSMDDMD